MMIKRFLLEQRKKLKLLILSLFILHSVLFSQDKDEGLELPEVYIYGSYLQKITFSPKKDFFPYIGEGNLFPLSREVAPGLHFPGHEREMGRFKGIDSYWILVDAAVGNWWSDKVFLDCGLKNDKGLLSLRFTDFRRRGWEESHSKANDYLMLKGVMGDENYYFSGNLEYNYDETENIFGTFQTDRKGVNLFSLFDFDPASLTLCGDLSLNEFPEGFSEAYHTEVTLPTISEVLQRYYVGYNSPLNFADINCTVGANVAGKSIDEYEFECSQIVTYGELYLKKNFYNMFTVSPGVILFFDGDDTDIGPLLSFRMGIPEFPVFPFIKYEEKKSINTLVSAYKDVPFIADGNEYSVLYEKSIKVGFDGEVENFSFLAYYSHKEYENYPSIEGQVVASFDIYPVKTRKDMLNTELDYKFENICFSSRLNYIPREKIPYEPVSEFDLGIRYEEFPRFIPFASLDSKFAIETETDTVDIFSVNGGVETQLLDNLVLIFEVENIFNRRYKIWDGYTEGGIQFYLSAKYKITK